LKEQTQTINSGLDNEDIFDSGSEPIAVWDPEVGMYISSSFMKNDVGNYVLRKKCSDQKEQMEKN